MTRRSSRIDEAVRAADARQDLASASTVSAAGSSARSAVSSSVSVEAGRRARPPLSWLEQVARVDEVAVVADGERPARPEPVGRLGVLPDRRAGRRVAAVGDRELAAQARQASLVEDRADHPEVLVEHQLLAVADRQPGRFLAAMLEREQARAPRSTRPRSARRRAGPPRTRRTSVSPPSRGRGRARGPRRDGGRGAGPRARRRRRPPRSSAAPVAPASAELDDEAVATDRADASRPAARAGGRAASAPRA